VSRSPALDHDMTSLIESISGPPHPEAAYWRETENKDHASDPELSDEEEWKLAQAQYSQLEGLVASARHKIPSTLEQQYDWLFDVDGLP